MSDRVGTARATILGRLRAARPPATSPPSDFDVLARRVFPPGERYPRLRRKMETVHAEFVETTEAEWPSAVIEFLRAERLGTLLYGPSTPAGRRLAQVWPSGAEGDPRLVPYDRPVETMKADLFDRMDAGFTTTRGGIADTGGLILWPSPEEPRLLSLVPPVHIALLREAEIYDTFWQAVRVQKWASAMPPNALLISGPSKTADIEQTLSYGVHGPNRLLVIVVR